MSNQLLAQKPRAFNLRVKCSSEKIRPTTQSARESFPHRWIGLMLPAKVFVDQRTNRLRAGAHVLGYQTRQSFDRDSLLLDLGAELLGEGHCAESIFTLRTLCQE
jgi:hypothetical protein